jgi:DNA-binding winged helix-turn-helix (wHTH) protein/tetratricopeptide (TPR) repeat protein
MAEFRHPPVFIGAASIHLLQTSHLKRTILRSRVNQSGQLLLQRSINTVANEKRILFDCFCLDPANECLLKGSETVRLRPKAFAVLEYLLRRPRQLVTKEEILNDIWPDTFVGEAVLKNIIRQLREILGDDPKSPRFIETAHRRGYRFIGTIEESRPQFTAQAGIGMAGASSLAPEKFLPKVVGRDPALMRMRGWLEKMLAGERQIVFVTGEAGIGKTSLVDAFARSVTSDGSIWLSRGQCLEQYGTSEAYMPVLEAIGRLCREQRKVVDVLRAHAPMWLLQLPSLVNAADRELLSRELSGATRERMLREMGEALEVLTAEVPLVLILEDLHWSDYSTLDMISYLARQREAAQLMLIGTYRTVELFASGHPLNAVKRELFAKQQCVELPLEYLSEEAVGNYLSGRFPTNALPPELAGLIHQRTEGNPLFMVNAVDYLVAEGFIAEKENRWQLLVDIENVEVGVPDSIKQMIEKQIDHLNTEERQTLEAASVAGAEFSVVALAAGLREDRAAIEARCEELARRNQFIQECGVQRLPNEDAVIRYGFIHALYQNVLYERLSPFKRIQLHQQIGHHGEQLYGERAAEIAAELAMHFERSHDYKRAAMYLQQAAENDIRRFAYQEAIVLSRRGLDLLDRLPDSVEGARQKLWLHLTLGVPLTATEGYAARDVGSTYSKARELCRQLGEPPEISQVLWGLWTFYLVRSELGTAREIAEEFIRLTSSFPYAALAMEVTLIHRGEFALAVEWADKALLFYDPEQHREDALRYSQNAVVATKCHAAWALWFLGQPDKALQWLEEAMTLAHELADPHGIAHVFFFASILHQLRGEQRMAQVRAEASIAISRENALALYHGTASVALGWATVQRGQQHGRQEETIEQMLQGLAEHQATGTVLLRPHFLGLVAEAFNKVGRVDEGLSVLDEALALAKSNGDRYYQAELYRLKGELLLAQSSVLAVAQTAAAGKSVEGEAPAMTNAENCFNQSIVIAQRQKARSLELRAVTSMARLYQRQGRSAEARDQLARIYSEFSEGFDTSDLREAQALLADLS